MFERNWNPATPDVGQQQGCRNCKLLINALEENRQIQREYDTVLKVMEFLLSITELWAKHNDFIPSGSGSKEDIEKEFSDGKDKVRTLFNNLIKTGEPAFLDRLFRVMNLPEDFQHLI